MDSTPVLQPPSSLLSTSKSATPARKKPPAPTLPPPAFSFKDASMDIILEDLSSRFILNLPDHELSSVERVSFQVEQAHWYYEDFIRQENPSLPSLPLRTFSAKLFAACPLLQPWSHRHEEAFDDFVKYKTSVPVCGAILLNSTWDKCVLVKGWKSSAPWGFPRGKINENEPLHTCATREVLEETGYNCEEKLLQDVSITLQGKDQQFVTLYVVPDVPEDYAFNTRTRKEISKIDWFSLSQLPGWQSPDDDDTVYHQHRGMSQTNQSIRTWSVSPFLTLLKSRLLDYQIAFGYTPPGLTARQLKEMKRLKRVHGRAASHQPHNRQTPSRTRNQVASHPGRIRDGATGDESTGAEGDEEPEAETETDHDTPHVSVLPSVTINDINSQSSADPSQPAASAIDALFTRSLLANNTNGNNVNSSPDVQGLSSLKKIVRPTKSIGKARSRISSANGVADPSPVPQETADATRELAQFHNLMQSTANFSPLPSADLAGSAAVGVTSGLPTPADSPVNTSNAAQIPHNRTATTIIASVTTQTSNDTAPPVEDQGGDPLVSSPLVPKSIFEFISPFDALFGPSPGKKKAKAAAVKPPVTILNQPSAESTMSSASADIQENGPAAPSLPWASSDAPASESDSFPSRSSSEDIGAPSSWDEDELLQPTSLDRETLVSFPEAPATLDLPTRTSGGMMSIRSPSTEAGSLEHAAYMTPKPKLPPIMGDVDTMLPGPLSRGSSSSSSATSSSAQHMALLHKVANEVDAMRSPSACATPQPTRSGVMLPQMTEQPAWNPPAAPSNGAVGLETVSSSFVDGGGMNGVNGGELSNRGPIQAYSRPMAGPMPPSMVGAAHGLPYPDYNGQGFPPEQQFFYSNRHVPYLHHPLPHLHPQQHISIPSASPSPHLVPPTVHRPAPPQELPPNAILSGDPRFAPPFVSLPGLPRPAPLPPSGLSRIPMMGQQGAAGSPSILQMLQGAPIYQSPMNPLAAGSRQAVLGKSAVGVGPQHLSSSSAPDASYPYMFNGNGSAASSPLSPQLGSLYPIRSPIPAPNPNSFVVQKSQADRNELLNLIRSRSPAPPVANTPLAVAATLPATPAGKDRPSTASNYTSPARTRTSFVLPASVLESGLIPANVQFLALARRTSNAAPSAAK